jgi:APA family basic amino acid/polyamine antiporter
MANLLLTKPLDMLLSEAGEIGEHSLKRVLGPVHLIMLGVGAIIGAGIFVLTGSAAARYAGPAIVISYVLAGVACAFAGLCYAEFASLIPIAGSAYTYCYATLGEIFAWVIGWDLILEYAFGAAAVASGWSSTLIAFLQDYGINIPPQICDTPGSVWVYIGRRWVPVTTLADKGIDLAALPHATAHFNLLAFLAIVVVTTILVIGIKESATLNAGIVFIKLFAVLTFIAVAATYAFHHQAQTIANLTPFVPRSYGWSGVIRAAGVVFFAYIGFDAVSTAAQEARNPQRDMPIGILGSLVVCTVLYILVSFLLTGTVHYTRLNVGAPVSLAIRETGVRWGSYVVNAGALAGLSTVLLVMLLGQSRVFYSMAHDGLLWKWAGEIHPKFRTPWKSSIVVGVFVALFAALVPIGILGELVSIGTLLAFVIVCGGIWILRVRKPEMHRPFKTPLVPFVPIMGMLVSLLLMVFLPWETWMRMVVWLVIGMVIYFSYSRHHSKVQAAHAKSVVSLD